VREGIATRTPIRMGATSISAVEILSGLKQGDTVVVAGTDAFNNAQRISINQ
jgi:HlyD family secretion protein